MKKADLIPSSDHAKRVATIMHRRLTTPWSDKEVKSFRRFLPLDEEDLANVERYYKWHWPPVSGKNVLRHDLYTLVNNWPGECDRARTWCGAHPIKPKPRKIIPMPQPKEQELTPEERAQASASFAALMGRKPIWEEA